MLTLRRSLLVRACAIIVIALHLTSCSKWEYVPNSRKPDLSSDLINQHVLFTEKEKTWDLYVLDVKYPFVHGPIFSDRDGEVKEVDLRKVTALQIYSESGAGDPVRVVNYEATLNNKHVKFYQDEKSWDLYVKEIAYPMVRGPYYEDKNGPVQELDLRNITGFSVHETGGQTTALVIVGIFAAIILIAALSSGNDSPPPQSTSGESCPVLYVCNDHGMQRIGEAYAGAAFRSLQRDDLLPLPNVSEKNLYCLFVNEANETQYTDALNLVVVDHPRGTRAVASVEQKPILVGDEVPPLAAVDATGASVLTQVAGRDSVFWQTKWGDVVATPKPPLQESIAASFAAPAAGAKSVLELELANTYWLEFVIGNLFGRTGKNFDDHMAQWNQPSNGPFVRGWLQREGVMLTVEEKRGGEWHPVAVVPPSGAMEMRHVAIELPAVERSPADPVEVRVKGGTGFWLIDHMSLSMRSNARATEHRLKPVTMIDENGADQRALVAATDNQFQVLETSGERLPFDFQLPRLKRGSERSLFLFTNGYYNVHKPAGIADTPSTVAPVASRPGGLVEMGIEIYRHYQKLTLETPRRAGTVTTVGQ